MFRRHLERKGTLEDREHPEVSCCSRCSEVRVMKPCGVRLALRMCSADSARSSGGDERRKFAIGKSRCRKALLECFLLFLSITGEVLFGQSR